MIVNLALCTLCIIQWEWVSEESKQISEALTWQQEVVDECLPLFHRWTLWDLRINLLDRENLPMFACHLFLIYQTAVKIVLALPQVLNKSRSHRWKGFKNHKHKGNKVNLIETKVSFVTTSHASHSRWHKRCEDGENKITTLIRLLTCRKFLHTAACEVEMNRVISLHQMASEDGDLRVHVVGHSPVLGRRQERATKIRDE